MAGRGNGSISMEAMRRHLDTIFIGYRPGDLTAGAPPATMPAPSIPPAAGTRTVDLRHMTQAQLQVEADATQSRDIFAALLPNPPGVPPDRIAYITGQEPTEAEEEERRRKRWEQGGAAGGSAQQAGAKGAALSPPAAAKLSDAKIAAVMGRYLAAAGGHGGGKGAAGMGRQQQQQPIPWAELGLADGGPRVGALECDLRLLWQLAHNQRHGWGAVEAGDQWAEIAREMGAANAKRAADAAPIVRQWYQSFLLPYERQLGKHQQGGGSKKKAGEGAAAMEVEVAGPTAATQRRRSGS